MDVLDNNNNIPFTPFDTHTHTHPGRFLPPSRLFQHKGAWNLILYEKGAQPFSFFSNPMRLGILHPTNTQTGEREREREKPPFRSNSFPALSPLMRQQSPPGPGENPWSPLFFCRPSLAFHLFFFFAFPLLLLLLPICCCAPKELQCNRTSPDLAPPPPRVGPEKHPEKLMWVENECRNNRAA